MHDYWTRETDKGNNVGVLLFDLSSAFDTLDQHLLIKKLQHLGFNKFSCAWFSSYLSGRTQQVEIGGKLSCAQQVSFGVPQGSVLSPLLFLLYISDMRLATKARVHGYADDTTASLTSPNINTLVDNLQKEASNLLKYMANNGLVANAQKTSLLVMRSKKDKKFPAIKIVCGESSIEESGSQKILGVEISSNLKWKAHEHNVLTTLRQRVLLMKKLSFSLPSECLLKVLDGMIMSHVRY
jgi:hypothetical protein